MTPTVIAHRGASGTAPENTAAALQRAFECGAEWAEVDVQRTADGVLVLVHDDTWERTAGDARAIAVTPWRDVRRFDAGAWFGPQFTGEPVPCLDDALTFAQRGLRLDLEIKSPESHPALAQDVVAAVRAAGVADRVVLSCFDLDVVEAVTEMAPEIRTAYLATSPITRRHPRVGLHIYDHRSVRGKGDLGTALEREGIVLWVYTVNEAADGTAALAAGARGLITNYPERFLAVRPSV